MGGCLAVILHEVLDATRRGISRTKCEMPPGEGVLKRRELF